MSSAPEKVAERIARRGPLPLSEVLDVALYDPEVGFYETGGAAGRREGDFLTSPEVGPLFGAVVARALDGWWHNMGCPDPYVVVEAGAGPGMLARTILRAEPECSPALRYILVERSATQRRRHSGRDHPVASDLSGRSAPDRSGTRRRGGVLPWEEPSLVLPPVDVDTEQPVPEAPRGPLCTSLADLPRLPGTSAVVLANELLDNLPFDLVERRDDGWYEVRVGVATNDPTALAEVLVPLDEARVQLLGKLAPDAAPGSRVPLQAVASDWLRAALATAGRKGRLVAIDYASTTNELATHPQHEWLRTYKGHAEGVGILTDLGTQDITCEVAVDQLAVVRPPTSNSTQHEWLQTWGIDDLVEEGRKLWTERAHIADLAAIEARSRLTEADALLDPRSLGAFRVLEWVP